LQNDLEEFEWGSEDEDELEGDNEIKGKKNNKKVRSSGETDN